MGNLGGYQAMTTIAKRIGGPKVLAVVTVAGGYALLRPVESGVKRAVRLIKKRSVPCPTIGQTFQTTTTGEDPSGLTIEEGSDYRVLERDGNAILIEVIGDLENPYFVSGAFLASISDFPPGSRKGPADTDPPGTDVAGGSQRAELGPPLAP